MRRSTWTARASPSTTSWPAARRRLSKAARCFTSTRSPRASASQACHRILRCGVSSSSEMQAALDAGVPVNAAVLTGIGYAEALAHLRGEVTLEDLPDVMAASNRRYARRQMRWWRRDPRITWFEIEPDPVPAILKYVENN